MTGCAFSYIGDSHRGFKGRKRDIYGSIVSQLISDILGCLRKYLLVSPLSPNLLPFFFKSKLRAVKINKILAGFSAPEPWRAGLENGVCVCVCVRKHGVMRNSPRLRRRRELVTATNRLAAKGQENSRRKREVVYLEEA